MSAYTPEQQVDSIRTNISKKIRLLRVREGLLQSELSARIGCRQQLISKLETGNFVRNEFMVAALKVSAYFKVDPAVFFFGYSEKLTPEALEVATTWENAPERIKRSVRMMLDLPI